MYLIDYTNYFLGNIFHLHKWSSLRAVRKFLEIGMICLLFSLPIVGQYQPIRNHFTQTIKDIDDRLSQGDKMAIRDLAVVWKQQPTDERLKDLANRYLLLTPEEYKWTRDASPEMLLQFFYQKEEHLHFSEFLKVFYITPIENWTTKAVVKEKELLQVAPFLLKIGKENIDYALQKKHTKALEETLKKIYEFNNATTIELLKKVAVNSDLYRLNPISKRHNILTSILDHLPDSTAVELLFKLGDKKKITPNFCRTSLAKVINYRFEETTLKGLKKEWKTLKATFDNNYWAIKTTGYEQAVKAQKIFFEEAVDYYAWILATTPVDSLLWIQKNALEDLIATKHPKVLFYLAGLQFRAWKLGKDTFFLSILERLTDVSIGVEDQSGGIVTTYEDRTAQLNFLIYWSQHYTDYEWEDSDKSLFANILQKSEIIDSYEKYFRRLNSSHDSAAIEAFYILTEGIPAEISKLMKKYRPLLRTYNSKLPPLKFNVIENISQLTRFCKQNGLAYQPTLQVKQQLLELEKNLPPKKRYELENNMIANLQLEELTYLEYWAAMKSQNMPLNFSIGRILDRLYTKYWDTIIQDNHHFRFYLLKSCVFRKLTSFGIARLYHEKAAENKESVQALLEEIAIIEQNELVKEALKFWQFGESQEAAVDISVKDLLKDPEAFDKANINKLPKFSQRELADFFFTLKSIRNRKALKKMEQYMGTYASVDLVPDLFSTPQKNWTSNPSAAKVIVKILEAIYGYSFSKNTETSIEKWYALWDAKKEVYADWGKTLFELQLEELRTKETLTINNINRITRSNYYKPSHRQICLNALKKVKKTRSISQLSIAPLLSVKEELHYLDSISFSYRELDNLPKILLIDDSASLLAYILGQTTEFNIDQKGYLMNNLLRQDWLFQLIDRQQLIASTREEILHALTQYLNESEYLTEFEEQATQLNLLLLLNDNKTLVEKLMVLNDPKLENKVKVKWLNIIFARMKFEEIKQIFPVLSTIEDFEEQMLFEFISKDFGLPIFDLDQDIQNIQLQRFLETSSEQEIYDYYLTAFGIDFKDKHGKLDFQKIYEILKYDLLIPFVGEGGQYRDYYVYAIIKVLELHFKTTLGFSPKLNEYQTFFQFNSFARVKAWKQYLIDHKYVKASKNKIPSFNEDF